MRINHKSNSREKQSLSDELLRIFEERPLRATRNQQYFEDRKVLETQFILHTIQDEHGQNLFGIEIQVEEIPVLEIQNFFKNVQNGKRYDLSVTFTYDPAIHCFQREVDELIQELIQICGVDKFFPEESINKKNLLLIPPSSWSQVLSYLINVPSTQLKYNGKVFRGLQLSEALHTVQFDFKEATGQGYQLSIQGLGQIMLMPMYHCVLDNGVLVHLDQAGYKQFMSIKEMLENTNLSYIPIPQEQLSFFLEKVLPGLKRLGPVHISETLSQELIQTPLVAKLYLDRIRNRLLAGLEFHYGNVVFNPLEQNKLADSVLLFRDRRKEDEILHLFDESGFAKTDEGYYLQNEELEYEFLYHTIPQLEKMVQIYATTAIRNRIFRSNDRPQIRVKVKRERTNWLEFKFEMGSIPESEIRNVLQALEEKRKYYRLRNGSLLSLEAREFEEINRFLRTVPNQHYEDFEKGLELPILKGISFLDAIMDNDAFAPEESFQQFLEEIRHPERLRFEVPRPLDALLREYQKQGYQWMKTLASYGFGGILGDDMGLGKTVQSITYIQSVLSEIRTQKLPALIVCPSSVTYNWLNEFKRFTPNIHALVIDGGRKERRRLEQNIEGVDVIIISYPLLRSDLHWAEQQEFHTAFFDEAQSFKNPITQTAKAVKKVKANHQFALTGTPVENTVEELWSIFHVVFPELFQGLREYSQLSRKQIARRSSPFLLRRLKEDVLAELPEKIEIQESVELYPEQKKLYAAYLAKLRHDTLKHLDKDTIERNRIRILAGLTRLRQICCHPTLFVDGYKGGAAKFDKLMQLVEESQHAGRRVLIFSQFTKMLGLIGRQLTLKGISYFYLDGATPSEERVELCDRFNSGDRSFFLISLKAGGTGLNLTGADTVILYDIWWNPAVEEQATDRAHRIGQEQTVKVIKLLSKGTIEEKMEQLQNKKRHLIEELIDSKENRESALTAEDIRDLLMLDLES
ncbi:DEAD/DEAH box helicase [Robertmurraya andreesenii]|uniref:SNF2 family DNA or RNA helicase n=1 Tax=Anoxybacillus andreesenii TaxID=1325932 RepID=A0ABT9V5H8_9BACL|nr:DEAD/DEAH box helicase [Robertmurraya andreesenii]MDQ0156196.1 SNF2 family DNA or RNA helicase [Robertmurraya andreesenii]